MICKKCNKIISESSLKCPYCGAPSGEDYFGYYRVNQQIEYQQNYPRKKDNSGKIILVVFGAIGGLVSIIFALIFMFSGQGTSTSAVQYDAIFEVQPKFQLFVTDSSMKAEAYRVSIYSDNYADTYSTQITNVESNIFEYAEGSYTLSVMNAYGESIVLRMNVVPESQFNSIELKFDERQIYATNQGDTDGEAVNRQQGSSVTTNYGYQNSDDYYNYDNYESFDSWYSQLKDFIF